MISTVVFDLGNVLIYWDPRHLYRKIFQDQQIMEEFLNHVCNNEWNELHDGGQLFAEGIRQLSATFPHYAQEIALFFSRWQEMLGGEITGSVEILKSVKQKGYPVYALSNWSAETFPIAQQRYEFLNWFDGIVLSGKEKMIKPNPDFFKLLLTRYKLKPEETIFIDDAKKNIEAASSLGINTIHFENPEHLRSELKRFKVL